MPKKITGSGSMSLEEALNSPNGYTSNSIESASLDPAMSQEVADILTENLPDNGFYFLGQAGVCAKEAWEWGNECQRLINERNEKIRACKALSSSKGGEALEYWKIMSTENEVTDFGKRVWEAIKNAIKKLILMIINFIKSVGNFIKGAMAKAQELFWKKYARQLSEAKESVGTMKIKAKSADTIWEKQRPDKFLKETSSDLMSIFGGIHKTITEANLDSNSNNANSFIERLKCVKDSPDGKKMFAQAGKWFPSAAKVVNEATYGVEKPSKFEVKIETILSGNIDLLQPGTLQILAVSLKCGQSANKSLTMILGKIDSISRAQQNERTANNLQNKYEGKSNKQAVTGGIQQIRRLLQFCTTLLLHAYGNALSARMMVFSAARKKVRGSSKADKEAAKEAAKNK